ncbi:hypothetical protein WJX73_007192 [Symbiochloris irregularis]|uniref:Uncharacterized protein n=1 Tax=Symbiochloris irregularis TaxID=706552 RepID=A0AAW1PFY8_9CHLO
MPVGDIEEVLANPMPAGFASEASLGELLDELWQSADLQPFHDLPPDSRADLPAHHQHSPAIAPHQSPELAHQPPVSALQAPVTPTQLGPMRPLQTFSPAYIPQQQMRVSEVAAANPCRWDLVGPADMPALGIVDFLQVGSAQQGYASQSQAADVGQEDIGNDIMGVQLLPPPSWEDILGQPDE